MKHCIVIPLAAATVAAIVAPARPAWAQNLKESRIRASYLAAFGRQPQSAEIADWMRKPDMSVPQIVEQHKGWLKHDAAEKERTIKTAMQTAWGDVYSQYYARYAASLGSAWGTHAELVDLMVRDMDNDKAHKEKIIRASYRAVGLTPSATDVWGWVNGLGNGKSYVRIVGEHLVWMKNRRMNLPPFTSQQVIPLHPQAIVELKGVPGMAQVVANGGGNIVANGGGNIVANGGGNIVANGGGNVVAFGNANLILPNSGSL
jgi:hypothetical protein